MQSSVWFKQALTYDINSSNNFFALICLKQSLYDAVFCLIQASIDLWHQQQQQLLWFNLFKAKSLRCSLLFASNVASIHCQLCRYNWKVLVYQFLWKICYLLHQQQLLLLPLPHLTGRGRLSIRLRGEVHPQIQHPRFESRRIGR